MGLKDVRVLHYRRSGPEVELMIEQVAEDVRCPSCGGRAQVKERPVVRYVDLPVYGAPMRLAWKKHRMRCVDRACARRTWMRTDHRIAAKNCLLTTRAAKWATVQVGTGRTVSEVAAELDCDWHTVNDAVTTYGEALLAADRKRLNRTTAIGLDETSFVRLGAKGHTDYATTVADVENHQIIDILPSRNYPDVAAWMDKQPRAWKERIRFGALDMSDAYAAVYAVILPKAAQVVDSFHAVALANRCLDDVRRRVQSEQTGHRGRRADPLWRARRLLVMGEERLDAGATGRLASLLELGDPGAEVAIAYRIKERLRDFYATGDPDEARQLLAELRGHCLKPAMPPEVQRLGRTIRKWFDKLCNYHLAKVSNGPTEALNNLIKRVKRIGFGFRNFKNYRIRALLYAGKPNWRVLGSIVVR
ncbi:MAG TPA: ISL3 family transposase [Acidimicrobiales bacterium]